jgi:hypothetical protein
MAKQHSARADLVRHHWTRSRDHDCPWNCSVITKEDLACDLSDGNLHSLYLLELHGFHRHLCGHKP